MAELWEFVKLALIIGLFAGIFVIVLQWAPFIPEPIKKIGTAVVVIIALILFVDRVIPMLGSV